MYKKLATPALPTALLATLLTLPLGAAPQEINALAAVVNGQVVTQSEVKEAVKHTEQMILLSVPPGPERHKQLRTLKSDALDSLIERELVLAEFAKLGGSIKSELIDEDIDKIIHSERFSGDRAKFLKELNATGMTLRRFKDLRRKILIVEMMRARQSGGTPIITPKQLNDAYTKHGDKFRDESFIRLRTIVLPKNTGEPGSTAESQRALITTIRKKILAGADFAQMAKTYSEDSVADKGGDRGTLGEESIELRRDLKDAAFQLTPGKVSEVIEDPYAFYLLLVENKKLGDKRALSDPEVRSACERLATMDLRKASHERWIARLRKGASIRVFDSGGKPVSPAPRATPTSPTSNLPSDPAAAAAARAAEDEPKKKKKKKSMLSRITNPFGLGEKDD